MIQDSRRSRAPLQRVSWTPLALLALLASDNLLAAEWEKAASVSASAFWTDNFCLSRDDKESEIVETVTPAVRLSGSGARANVALNARVEFNTAGQSDIECLGGAGGGQGGLLNNRESVIPSGSFTADYEAIENWLVLEANAFAGFNPVNPFAAGNNDAINGRNNNNITYRWGLGARIEREFERELGLSVRYNYNEQYNSVNQVFGDSSEDRVDASLRMLPGTSRFLLSAVGRYSEVSFEETAFNPAFTNTLSSAELRASFALTNSWEINALAGEEFNEFLSTTDEIDGEYWDVGLRWTPNSRVTVDVGTGERFFGDTPRASVSYRHKRSRLSMSYERNLSFPRNLRAPTTSNADDPFPPGFNDLPGDPVDPDGNPVLIGDSPILNESLTLNYSYSARRTRFNVTARESKQTRARDLASGTFRNASVGVTRELGFGISFSTRLSWRESEGTGAENDLFGQNVEAWIGDVVLSKRIARRTSASFSYRYTDQQSDFALNEYQENRLTLSLRHDF